MFVLTVRTVDSSGNRIQVLPQLKTQLHLFRGKAPSSLSPKPHLNPRPAESTRSIRKY